MNASSHCRCGSGESPYPLLDARGIYVAKVCSECEDGVKARFRPEIFEDSQYSCDEQIEPD